MNIIFDLDGTLFRTETVDIEAFNMALADMGYPKLSGEEILGLIGYPLESICQRLTGSRSKDAITSLAKLIIKYELELIEKQGELYEGVMDLLRTLKAEGHNLSICSNGSPEYVQAIVRKFKLDSFINSVWPKKYGWSKTRALGRLLKKNKDTINIFIGDRQADYTAAKAKNCTFIWAKYGFAGDGEITDAPYTAESVQDIEKLIDKIK